MKNISILIGSVLVILSLLPILQLVLGVNDDKNFSYSDLGINILIFLLGIFMLFWGKNKKRKSSKKFE
ncbi:MAG TPA: hypothetical protein PKV88_04420 [Bacteroidales bacterium]|nr:hypothetical protein [Bacteroidales bacterium]MDD4087464.1 hypothetical protein [Bacteroidales bacterium]MDY0085161.1 hypothetical protein [Bacteroidales bacterium]HPE43306.1 hypothetical protein [Bacteroidales bacterium]